jgi:hypothetical protein
MNDYWTVALGAAYLVIIIVLEKRGYFTYFRGISAGGAYAFIALIIAHQTVNSAGENPYLSAFGYMMIANFIVSCGYLVYVLHTSRPDHGDAES